MLSEAREFKFRRNALLVGFVNVIWVLCTGYFLWRIAQAIAGSQPWWSQLYAPVVIVYMWYMVLAPVKSIAVTRDGRVLFTRRVGRPRVVEAIDIKVVRPCFNIGKSDFVLEHTGGWELLFEDRRAVALVVRELLRWNPELKLRGVRPAPEGVENGDVSFRAG